VSALLANVAVEAVVAVSALVAVPAERAAVAHPAVRACNANGAESSGWRAESRVKKPIPAGLRTKISSQRGVLSKSELSSGSSTVNRPSWTATPSRATTASAAPPVGTSKSENTKSAVPLTSTPLRANRPWYVTREGVNVMLQPALIEPKSSAASSTTKRLQVPLANYLRKLARGTWS
jgi:hypothetical protein